MYNYLSFWNDFNSSDEQQSSPPILVYVQSPAAATKQTTTTVAAAEMEGNRHGYSYATLPAAITDEIQNNVEDIQKEVQNEVQKLATIKTECIWVREEAEDHRIWRRQ